MGINLTTGISSLGYGVVGLNVLLSLRRKQERVSLWPIGQIEASPEHHSAIQECIYSAKYYDPFAPSLRIYHQFDLAQHVGNGLHAAYPFFELNRFKRQELHQLKSQNIVFASSKWAAEVLAKEGVSQERIKLARPGVDTSVFASTYKQQKDDEPTVFLTVGKWEIRKGHDFLINAFNKAFEPNDDVVLVMHCFNPCFRSQEEVTKYNNEWSRFALNTKLGDKIQLTNKRFQSHAEVAHLMSQADCGVFPSKAEGWGLESAEMLAMGKHVIITDYSSHTEYANADNSRLIYVDNLEPANDGIWFNADSEEWDGKPGEWAALGKSQEEQLITHLRDIHRLRSNGILGQNTKGLEIGNLFSWNNTAKEILDGLRNS